MQPSIPGNLNLNLSGLKPSATLAINELSRTLERAGQPVYRLGFGQSPFPVPEVLVEALRRHAAEKDYLEISGLPALREAIAAYYQRRQGLARTADDIVIGPGSKVLLFLLQLAFYGDLILPRPSWVSYAPQAQIIGRRVQWIDTTPADEWRLTPEALEAVCAADPERPRLLILNYPSNPLGISYDAGQLRRLAAVARKYRLLLLSDEIYGELDHRGGHVSIARFYPEGTIISSGLSKWCGAGGWRLGFFVFPAGLRRLKEALIVAAGETFTSTSAPIQYAAVAAFSEDPAIDRYLQDTRRILSHLGRSIHERLARMHVPAPRPQGGFYLFPDFSHYREKLRERNITTSHTLCTQLLADTGVALLPGADFGFPDGALTARLSYVAFDGLKALKLARAGHPLDDTFRNACASRMFEAMDRLETWLST